MKTKLPLLIVILLIATAVQAQVPGGIGPGVASWARYMIKGEEFSVALPSEPSLKTSQVPLARVKKNRLERVMQANADGLVYTVYVYENPKPRQSLEDFIAEQSSALDVATERIVINGKFSGKEYLSKDARTTEQFFATEKRFYRFVVSGATDEAWRVKQFFSSIFVGRKPAGLEVTEGPSPADGLGEIVSGKEVDRKARLLSKPEPSYSDIARSKEIEGTVILRAVFSANGQVTNIRVIQGLPYGLTERAIAAARKIKFVPAVKDGKNVSMWFQLEYNFNLY